MSTELAKSDNKIRRELSLNEVLICARNSPKATHYTRPPAQSKGDIQLPTLLSVGGRTTRSVVRGTFTAERSRPECTSWSSPAALGSRQPVHLLQPVSTAISTMDTSRPIMCEHLSILNSVGCLFHREDFFKAPTQGLP